MTFPLIQLYSMNRSKPIVEVDGIDGTFFTISGSILDDDIYGTLTNIFIDEVRLNENETDLYEEISKSKSISLIKF